MIMANRIFENNHANLINLLFLLFKRLKSFQKKSGYQNRKMHFRMSFLQQPTEGRVVTVGQNLRPELDLK